MRKLLIVVLVLAFASPVDAARRWFVQTSDNKIISFTDDDNAPTPAGTIAVADAVIRTEDPPGATGDITPLGTWDGSTYTAPSGGGIVVPYDPTTDSGAGEGCSCARDDGRVRSRSWIDPGQSASFGLMLPTPVNARRGYLLA